MTDEEALKARVEEAAENLDYYLRNYNRLLAIGYRKAILDAEIEYLKEFIKHTQQPIERKACQES